MNEKLIAHYMGDPGSQPYHTWSSYYLIRHRHARNSICVKFGRTDRILLILNNTQSYVSLTNNYVNK